MVFLNNDKLLRSTTEINDNDNVGLGLLPECSSYCKKKTVGGFSRVRKTSCTAVTVIVTMLLLLLLLRHVITSSIDGRASLSSRRTGPSCGRRAHRRISERRCHFDGSAHSSDTRQRRLIIAASETVCLPGRDQHSCVQLLQQPARHPLPSSSPHPWLRRCCRRRL